MSHVEGVRVLKTSIGQCFVHLVVMLCAFHGVVNAHDQDDPHVHAVQAVDVADMYRPTAMPDRIILTWSDDPKTTQAVTWRTSPVVEVAYAELAVAEAGPTFAEKSTRHRAKTESLRSNLSEAHFHSVVFENLTPQTRYAYRVGDGTNWSEWFQFSTAAAEPVPFSFVYFGDAQNNLRSLWSRVIREAYRDAPKAAFLLHAGDLVNRAESDAEWGEWFGAGAWLNAMMPSVAVPGNHEQVRDKNKKNRVSHHWRPSFTFPENGPPGLEETCYSLTYQNLRIIAMNSNSELETQASWLDDILRSNTSTWTIVTFHHPIFSTGKNRDNPEIRRLWKPVFDKHRVDLVLQGHDHTYGRTGLKVPDDVDVKNVATGVQAIDKQHGTVYVVSVSGPKMYVNSRPPFMKRLGEDTQLYQVISIDADRLRFEARTAVGQLYDAFELHKQKGQNNTLVEIEPAMEQRLRPR